MKKNVNYRNVQNHLNFSKKFVRTPRKNSSLIPNQGFRPNISIFGCQLQIPKAFVNRVIWVKKD